MAKEWEYNEKKNGVIIAPPSQRLRITGHRMASVLGLNKYQTPFGAWAEITKLVKLPFEDTKYTLAGKAIEPKQIEYVKTKLPNIMSIEEYYGNSFDSYHYNNFKDDSNIFGGVIDLVSTKNDLKTIVMIGECKTSSKPQEWANGNVPVEYLLQGALYSYMKKLDRVVFICSFLEDADYNHPETFEVNDKNTTIVIKKLDEMIFEVDGELLNIEGCIQKAMTWWNYHIELGISPIFDEKLDKAYLDIIRATDATQDSKLVDVCTKAFDINEKIKEIKKDSGIDALEKELTSLEASIKKEMTTKEIASCGNYKLSKKVSEKFNEKGFAEKEPNLYKAYCEEVVSYTLTKNKKEEEEEE